MALKWPDFSLGLSQCIIYCEPSRLDEMNFGANGCSGVCYFYESMSILCIGYTFLTA